MCYIETTKKSRYGSFFVSWVCFMFNKLKHLFDALLFPVLVGALPDLRAQNDEGDQVEV